MTYLCFTEAIGSSECVSKARVESREVRFATVQEVIFVLSKQSSEVKQSSFKEVNTQTRLTRLCCEATVDIRQG